MIFSWDEEGTEGWSSTGFWHRQTDPQNVCGPAGCLPQAFSGSTVWWYGDVATGTFACNTGTCAADCLNSGALTSPPINISGATNLSLSFAQWWEIESVDPNFFDTMDVQIFNATTGVVLQSFRMNPFCNPHGEACVPFASRTCTRSSVCTFSDGFGNSPIWVQCPFSLGPYPGVNSIKIRFVFNTLDPLFNRFRGWLIDNITVTADVSADTDGDGFTVAQGDCNDNNSSINPGAQELCNGVDDNCNGTVDEGFDVGATCTAGTGACQNTGTKVCAANGLATECNATPKEPGIEVCNGTDDDCDGAVDESSTNPLQPLTQSCYSGPAGTQGVGVCQAGTQTCQNGNFGTTCPGEVTPSVEVCDGLDNDCDGMADEKSDVGASCTTVGTNVVVQPADSTTLTFDNVTQAGTTNLTTSSSGPTPPVGFSLGDPPTYYELMTTAVFSGSVEVCINYSGISFTNESNLKLFHFEGGEWVDRTISLDTTNNIICASVTSLSPFAIFQAPVPFASFAAEVEIELGPLANDDEFEVKATFTLGTGSDGIDPLSEDVSLEVGTFATTIPAGSFEQDEEGEFKFEVDGLEVKITPLGGDTFEFKAEGEGADLSGTVNPVEVDLTIGNDSGSTTVTAEIEGEEDEEDEEDEGEDEDEEENEENEEDND